MLAGTQLKATLGSSKHQRRTHTHVLGQTQPNPAPLPGNPEHYP